MADFFATRIHFIKRIRMAKMKRIRKTGYNNNAFVIEFAVISLPLLILLNLMHLFLRHFLPLLRSLLFPLPLPSLPLLFPFFLNSSSPFFQPSFHLSRLG